jgi:hypothetical protein
MTLADAPTSVPLPLKINLNYNFWLQRFIKKNNNDAPPRHGPNANAQTSGCNGNARAVFCVKATTTLTIIVVTGMLSTKADVIADT